MNILIVDDDKTMTFLLSKLLQLEKIKSTIFSGSSIEDLIEIIISNEYDLVLMDIYLDKFNGLSALKAIRGREKLNQIVLMTSGMDKRSECISAGADEFLQKPFMPEEMLSQIRRLVGECP